MQFTFLMLLHLIVVTTLNKVVIDTKTRPKLLSTTESPTSAFFCMNGSEYNGSSLSFIKVSSYSAESGSTSFAAGDVNGDNYTGVIIANHQIDPCLLYLGMGNGIFANGTVILLNNGDGSFRMSIFFQNYYVI